MTQTSTALRLSLALALVGLLAGCDFMWPKYNACHTGQCVDMAVAADLDTAADVGLDADAVPADLVADQDAARGDDQAVAPPAWAVSMGAACGSADAGAAGCVHEGQAIAVEKKGNVLVAGTFQGAVTFGGTSLTSTGTTADLFVAVLNPSGKVIWATASSTKAGIRAGGLAVDNAGNAYIIGTITGPATLGSTSLTVTKTAEMFLAKLDITKGAFVWAVTPAAEDSEGTGVAVGPKGHPHVTGSFRGAGKFGQTTALNSKHKDVFVAKVDSAKGTFTWVAHGGGTLEDRALAIAVEGKGHAYITGKFSKIATFGVMTVKTAALSDMFVAKVDPKGNFEWAYGTGKASLASGTGLCVDHIGNAYVTGTFRVSTQFGSTAIKSKAYTDFFAAKIDVAGNWIWAAGGETSCGAKADAGAYSCEAWATGIALGVGGDVLVTGKYHGALKAGNLTSKGEHDVFVARVSATASLKGGASAGGKGADTAAAIAADGQDNAYVTGSFAGSAGFGGATLSAKGGKDVFVWKARP